MKQILFVCLIALVVLSCEHVTGRVSYVTWADPVIQLDGGKLYAVMNTCGVGIGDSVVLYHRSDNWEVERVWYTPDVRVQDWIREQLHAGPDDTVIYDGYTAITQKKSQRLGVITALRNFTTNGIGYYIVVVDSGRAAYDLGVHDGVLLEDRNPVTKHLVLYGHYTDVGFLVVDSTVQEKPTKFGILHRPSFLLIVPHWVWD